MKRISILFLLALSVGAVGQSFVSDGIVYGITSGQTVEVQPYHNLLNNPYSGPITIPQTVDIGDFIRRHPHPQYNKYLDPRKFSRFTIESGNIVWGKNWDLIFPVEQLHNGTIA